MNTCDKSIRETHGETSGIAYLESFYGPREGVKLGWVGGRKITEYEIE